MSATDTPRNGSPRVHPDLLPPAQRSAPKIHKDKSGSSGRTPEPVEAESSVTGRERFLDRTDRIFDWVKGFFALPNPLTQPPADWAELTAYAHYSVRMQHAPALVRFISSLWLYAIALPTIALGRWREWVLTRPGRAVLFLGVAELFLRTTPIGHAVGDLIRSLYAGLAWLLLP
jgi:hypothetical protein